MEASAAVPSDHSWVSDGTALMTGASFIHAIHVRGATVSTWGRSARGRQQAADKCDMWGGGGRGATEHGGLGTRGMEKLLHKGAQNQKARRAP